MSDLIPNEGQFFGVPENQERTIENNQEKAQVLQVSEFIQAEIEWYDKQIDETNRMTNLDTSLAIPIESQVEAYQMLADLLNKKKGELQAIADLYIKQ